MSDKHLLEALLRPPVEFYPAVVHGSCAFMCAAAPWSLALHPSIGYGLAGVFAGLGVIRCRQGWRIVRYHRNLKRLPYYALTSRQIPVSTRFLFLGRGFEWKPKHTQRLHDCFSSKGEPYLEPSKLFKWAREFEKKHDNFLTKLTATDSVWNPVRPLPPVGGIPTIHGIELDEQDIMLPMSARAGNTLIFGTTGVGKTRCAEVLVTQDIQRGGNRLSEQEVVVFFDPKGDPDMLKRMYFEAKRAGREQEFYVFHLGHPDISARYNAVGRFGRISEVAGRISGQLSGAGNSAAFKEFGWRFVNIIARALVELGRRPDYLQISRYVQNIDALFLDYAKIFFDKQNATLWPELLELAANIDVKSLSFGMKERPLIAVINQYILENKVFDPILEGLASAVRYDKTYFDKIVASLLPLLEKLTTGKISELLSPDYSDIQDERPIFDWESIIRKRGIVYVGLDALSDATVAAAVGNSMFADLVSMAGHIYKFGTEEGLPSLGSPAGQVKINLHCDEFNELMGDEFIPLINKGRGAGIQVTAYTQTMSDIEARIGNRAKAGQTIGNFNTLLMFRVKEPATAELLTKQLHDVTILQSVVMSGTTDSSNPDDDKDFTSNTGDRIMQKQVPMLVPANITNLPKGQAFALLEGSKLYKIRMPLPAIDKDDMMPQSIRELANYMRQNYHMVDNWWEPAFTEYVPDKESAQAFESMMVEGRSKSAAIPNEVPDAEISFPLDEEMAGSDDINLDEDEIDEEDE